MLILMFQMRTWHTWITSSSVGVSSVTFITLTPVSVRPDNALSIDCAVAGVNTVLIATCQHLGTLLVHNALRSDAGNIWVTPVLRWTVAASIVIPGLAECVNTTLSETAGGDTVPVDTLVTERTLQITLASSYNMCIIIMCFTVLIYTHVLYMQCRGCPLVVEDRDTRLGGC